MSLNHKLVNAPSTAAPDLLFNTFPPFDYIFRANNLRLQKAEDAEEEEEEEDNEEEVNTKYAGVQCISVECSAL